MFSFLLGIDLILVTGMQRSGTRIATQMIASDLQLEYIDEVKFGVHFFYKMLPMLTGRVAIHAPALSAYCHLLPPDVAVVWMLRPVEEVIHSEQRIGWNENDIELNKYFLDEGDIHELKYSYWRKYQKPKIKYAFEFEYHKLSSHPLWIQDREDFHWKQTGF